MFRGTLSPKIALSLIDSLPTGSNFVAHRRGGPQFVGMDEAHYLQVGQFNLLQNILYAFVSAHSKKSIPKPKSWPTPKEKKVNEQPTPGGFEAMIAAAKARRARKIAQQAQQTEE